MRVFVYYVDLIPAAGGYAIAASVWRCLAGLLIFLFCVSFHCFPGVYGPDKPLWSFALLAIAAPWLALDAEFVIMANGIPSALDARSSGQLNAYVAGALPFLFSTINTYRTWWSLLMARRMTSPRPAMAP
jgi:hypothetical protein